MLDHVCQRGAESVLFVGGDPELASERRRREGVTLVCESRGLSSRDGGRDAVGEYRLGPEGDPIRLQFALEAKCYSPDGKAIGVGLVSRLISRI